MAVTRPGFPQQADGVQSGELGHPLDSEIETTILNGAGLDEPTIKIPTSAIVGTEIQITGVVGLDRLTGNQVRVAATTSTGLERIDNVGHIGAGSSKQFNIVLPAPQTEQTIQVRLKAQEHFVSGWDTQDTFGPKSVNIVTEGQQIRQQAINAAPWVIGGGTIGGGIGRVEPRIGVGAGAALGVGVGASAFALSDENLLPSFTFPTVPVIATAGLLGASALLLAQLPDVPDLPSPTGSRTPQLPS